MPIKQARWVGDGPPQLFSQQTYFLKFIYEKVQNIELVTLFWEHKHRDERYTPSTHGLGFSSSLRN